MGKKAVQSMQGGEEGYKQAMKRAHTSKHFTAPAPRFQQSIPKTAQPQDDEDVVHVAPYDPRFLSDTSAPQAPLLPPPPLKREVCMRKWSLGGGWLMWGR